MPTALNCTKLWSTNTTLNLEFLLAIFDRQNNFRSLVQVLDWIIREVLSWIFQMLNRQRNFIFSWKMLSKETQPLFWSLAEQKSHLKEWFRIKMTFKYRALFQSHNLVCKILVSLLFTAFSLNRINAYGENHKKSKTTTTTGLYLYTLLSANWGDLSNEPFEPMLETLFHWVRSK